MDSVAYGKTVIHGLHHAAADFHTAVSVDGIPLNTLSVLSTLKEEVEAVGVAGLEEPAHHRAFGHRGVAEVHHRLGLTAGVGRVGEHHAERQHLRVGQHLQHMPCVYHAGALEGELLRAAHLTERVFEEGRGELGHLVAAAFDVDEGLVGQRLAVDLDAHLEILAGPHHQRLVQYLEAERRGTLIDGAVVGDTARGLRHHLRRQQQQGQ